MVQHLTATSQLLVGYNETELICKKNTYPTRVQNLKSLALAVVEILHGV